MIDLNDMARRNGQLLVWERAARGAPGLGGRWPATTAMLIAFGAVAAAVVLLLQWLQRRGIANH